MSTRDFEKNESYCVPLWIDGTAICDSKITKIDVTTPPEHEKAWSSCVATPDTINQAIQSASKAFKSWSKTKISDRSAILRKAADLIEQRKDELTYYTKKEIAADDGFIDFVMFMSPAALRSVPDILEDSLKTESVDGGPMKGIVHRVPYGVVAALAPWNGSLYLGLRAILFPIAAGNTVVFLTSPLSPMTQFALVQILEEAGLPKGVLNALPGSPEPAKSAENVETLLKNPAVRYLNFTGSTVVGRKINEVAGRYGKPVTMELGGKCVALALHDADVDSLTKELMLGAYNNSGQICMSTEHAIIPKSIKSDVVEKLRSNVAQMFPDKLPLVTNAAVTKIKDLITDALSKGAKLEFGEVPEKFDSKSSALHPMLLTGVTKEMQIYNTETFGPIFCLLEYDDSNLEEALDIVNGLDYGLSVSVFSQNVDEAEKVALDIDSGAVHINHNTVYDHPAFPHGGVKGSGYGRFGGRWGIEEFTMLKTITKAA